jgi:3-methyl-2-oxobutanoate hydroxymethyltransferase
VQELAERIVLEKQIAHVDRVDLRFNEVEVVVETVAGEVGIVRIPADPDVGVVGHVDDPADVGEERGFGAVDFKADLLAVVGGEAAELVQGGANLLEGFFLGDGGGECIGADLDAGSADVMGEDDIGFGGVDVLAEFGGIGSVIIEGAAEAHEFDTGILESFSDIGAFGGGKADLDAVGMGGAQLDALEPGLLAIPDEGVEIPVFGEVVSDGAQAQPRGRAGSGFGRGTAHRTAGRGSKAEAGGFQEGSAIWVHDGIWFDSEGERIVGRGNLKFEISDWKSHVARVQNSKVTVDAIRSMKGREPIAALTAYDYPMTRLLDEAGTPLILVGDSLGMVVLGYPDTTQVTMADMEHHVRAAARARPSALLAADLPYGSIATVELAVASARRLAEAGAEAVKAEGGRAMAGQVAAMVAGGVPVIGHLGMLPQNVRVERGYRIKGRRPEERTALLEDADALVAAGVFAIVLELVAPSVAEEITLRVPVPTIGIGSGPGCDGQILVTHDLIGLYPWFTPKHVRPMVQTGEEIRGAVVRWRHSLGQGPAGGGSGNTELLF